MEANSISLNNSQGQRIIIIKRLIKRVLNKLFFFQFVYFVWLLQENLLLRSIRSSKKTKWKNL